MALRPPASLEEARAAFRNVDRRLVALETLQPATVALDTLIARPDGMAAVPRGQLTVTDKHGVWINLNLGTDGYPLVADSTVLRGVKWEQLDHNDLTGLQGGTAAEYYHLTASEHTELNAWLDDVTLGADGAITSPVDITAANFVTAGNVDIGGFINDGAREVLKFTKDGAAVNELTIANAATGSGPSISATGDDASIDIRLLPKTAEGKVYFGTDVTIETYAVGGGKINFTTSQTASISHSDPSGGLVIDGDQYINIIGGTTITLYAALTNFKGNVLVEGEVTAYDFINIPAASATSAVGPKLTLQRGRGSIGSPTAIQSGDYIRQDEASGHDGAGYDLGAEIRVLTTEVWNATDHGCMMEFYVTDNGAATPALAMTIYQNLFILAWGDFGVTGNITVGGTVDGRDIAADGAVLDTALLQTLANVKGDIFVATADDTVTRLAVGLEGKILTANPGEATGVKWADVEILKDATPELGGNLSCKGRDILDADRAYVKVDDQLYVTGTVGIGVTPYAFIGLAMTISSAAINFGISNTFTYTGAGATISGIASTVTHDQAAPGAHQTAYGLQNFVTNKGVANGGRNMYSYGAHLQAYNSGAQDNATGDSFAYSCYCNAAKAGPAAGTTAGNMYGYSLFVKDATAPGGTPTTSQEWCALFEGDVQINSDKKFILEGSATNQGDSYIKFNSANQHIEFWIDGVLEGYVDGAGFNSV